MDRFYEVLSCVVKTLQGHNVTWALTGSTSFALQGVPVEVHDIDIQTDAEGAYVIQSLFPGNITRPVKFLESPRIRSHFGAMEIDGVTIEIMGAVQKRIPRPHAQNDPREDAGAARHFEGPDGSDEPSSLDWEPPVDVESLRVFTEWQGYLVPVLPIEYEYGAYLSLGRLERSRLLRQFLRERIENGSIAILCSTAPLARLAHGSWSDPRAIIEGVSLLGWPSVELRLWDEWNRPFVEVASQARNYSEVLSVHAPPVTEELLSMSDSNPAHSIIEKCIQCALVAGAKLLVIHAWDLRRKSFNMESIIRNLNNEANYCLDKGIQLSVENIPGHSILFPYLVDQCPQITFTIDTQWTALENSWQLVYTLTPRVNSIHVQTYIDVIDGSLRLGRVSGGEFEPGQVLREFVNRGFKGLITLEPKNVTENSDAYLKKALVMLKKFTHGAPGS